MLLRADCGLRTIRMCGEKLLAHCNPFLFSIVCKAHIVFFIHSFKLGMKASNDHISKTFGLYFGPIVHLVRRYILHIACNIRTRKGIRAFRTDSCHELIVFVRYVITGRQLRDTVYFVIGFPALCRVFQQAILLISAGNILQIRRLFNQIRRAKAHCAFKHKVLEIMRQSRCLSRIVTTPRAHGDKSLYARLLFVYREINLQAVAESINACVH